jgi:hypothetical protein
MDFAPLRHRTAEVDEQREPVVSAPVTGPTAGPDPAASRRRFLRRAAAGGAAALGSTVAPFGALAAAAQTDDTSPASPGGAGGPDDTTGAAGESLEGTADTLAPGESCEGEPVATGADIATVQFLETLSRAAVEMYDAAVERRLLTAVEGETALQFRRHHTTHAEALHCAAGGEPLASNPRLLGELSGGVTDATDEQALLQVLHDLEESLAATSSVALAELEEAEAAAVVAAILPVQAEHAVVWAELLELPPADYLPTVQTDAGAFDRAGYAVG